jgi:DNA-directed RNA polymerase subunit omega
LIFPSADRLEAKVGNKYSLVILAAKRARQLKEGAMPMAESTSPNPLSIAMDEVAVDKIIALAPPELQERDPVLDMALDDAASAAVLLSSLSGEDLDLEDGEDHDLLVEEEEEAEPALGLASTDDEEEAEEEEPEAELDEESEEE